MQVEENAARLKLTGWKSKKTTYLEFYRCPGCRRTQETILWGADKMANCFSCQRSFPKDDFASAKVKRTVVECRECGVDVPLTPSFYGFAGLGYICSKCGNYRTSADCTPRSSMGMETVSPHQRRNESHWHR